ncbi:hypothetical protein BDD12DRAFT_837059 [Trichophaea hybrida]|nr:hypothetical protein BDD12DRAFT_837059 [Trichophaea hybrida]
MSKRISAAVSHLHAFLPSPVYYLQTLELRSDLSHGHLQPIPAALHTPALDVLPTGLPTPFWVKGPMCASATPALVSPVILLDGLERYWQVDQFAPESGSLVRLEVQA